MALVVQNLSHKYLQGKYILENITIEISDGEIVALVGRSGCGKSTLLHCIAGLISPTTGTIMVDRNDVTHRKPHERGIGIMMQDQPLYDHLSVEKNIAFPLRARGKTTTGVTEIIKQLQLEDVAKQTVSKCSGGERRRVSFGRAIATKPCVLLLDEPFNSLNEELRESMRQRIEETSVSTLIVTHDLHEAESIADRVLCL